MTGSAAPPRTATTSPTPLRMSWLASMSVLELSFGRIDTRLAPAPFSVRLFVIVTALLPAVPGPSRYVPGQMAIVSPAAAASTAACTLVNCAAGQSPRSSSTVHWAASAGGAALKTPSTASAAVRVLHRCTATLSLP